MYKVKQIAPNKNTVDKNMNETEHETNWKTRNSEVETNNYKNDHNLIMLWKCA